MAESVSKSTTAQLASFAMAGTLGFLVDSAVVTMLMVGAGWGPYWARLISFVAAGLTTYLLNRRYTFKSTSNGRGFSEAAKYFVAICLGFAVNYGTYVVVIKQLPMLKTWPVVAVAAGSIAGLIVNFLSSRYWVFRSQ